MLENRNF